MKTKFFPSLIIIIFLIIFIIFYKGLQNTNIYTPKSKINQDIPLFDAQIFDTDKIIKSEEVYKSNKFYIMNIWSSWCIPCREEHALLVNLSKEKNIEIIGLNFKDDIKKAKTFLSRYSSPYKVILSDTDGTIAIEWGAYGVPETFLIYNKKVIKKIIGPLNENSLASIKILIK